MCVTDGFQEAFRIELETLELDTPEMYPSTLEEIKAATEADSTLLILCDVVANGWPSDKSHVPTALRHYYPLRDELAVYQKVPKSCHSPTATAFYAEKTSPKPPRRRKHGASSTRGYVLVWNASSNSPR